MLRVSLVAWQQNLLGHKALFSTREQEQRSLVQHQRLALQCVMRMQKDWSKLEQAQAVCRWVEGCELHRMQEALQSRVKHIEQALASSQADAAAKLEEMQAHMDESNQIHHSDVEALGEQLVAQLESAEAESKAKQQVVIRTVETDLARRFCCHILWAMMSAHASSLWVSCTSRALSQWWAQKELCEMEERLVAAQAARLGEMQTAVDRLENSHHSDVEALGEQLVAQLESAEAESKAKQTALKRAGDLRWCLSVRSMMLRTLLKSHLMQVVWCVHLAVIGGLDVLCGCMLAAVADIVVWMAVEAWAGVLSTASCSCSGGVDASAAAATEQVDGRIDSMEMCEAEYVVFVLQVG